MAEAPRFYIFHGEDEFTQKETLADLKEKMGGDPSMVELNTSVMDGATVQLGEVMHACNSLPFLSDKRLVIVSGLLERLSGRENAADRETLLDFLTRLAPTTRLIFMERKRLSAQSPFIRLASNSPLGYIKAFGVLKGRELEQWIEERVQDGGGRIEPEAMDMLAIGVGDDLRLLNLEIDKLLSFTGLERPIGPADVEALVPMVSQSNIFELVDAIGQQRSQKAAALLHNSLAAGADPGYLFAMIVRQFRLLIQVREKLDEGVRPSEMGRVVGIHSFVATKMSQQAAFLPLERLEQIYRQLLDTDVAIKTGRLDAAAALDLLVVELAGAVV